MAISALAVPQMLKLGNDACLRMAWDSAGYYWASGLCAAAALLPGCLCMGATIPLAMSAIGKRFPGPAKNSFSFLYAANLIGAAAGAALPALALVELLGFGGTLRLTACLNALIALAAIAMGPDPAAPEPPPLPVKPSGDLILLFSTGLCGMGMEVVWIRQFTPYCGTTVYAFAAILTLYLGASFAGSRLYRSRLGAGGGGWAWILSGALALLPIAAADPFLPVPWFARLLIGVAPICLAMGYLTPCLVDRSSEGDPRKAGAAYAVNVLGCIAGPLISGFLLLPRLPERWALAALSAPFLAAGFSAAKKRQRRERVIWAALAAAGAGMAAFSSSFEDMLEIDYGRVAVLRDYQADVAAAGEGMHKALKVNGVGMTQLTPITKMMAHLPLAFLGRPPRNSLVICFGMGTTFRSLLSWGIPSTAVELVPSVPRLFGFFHADADRLAASPLSRIVVDDGRRFLGRTSGTYDAITVDAAPPVEAAGTSLLFTTEFYALALKRLSPDGILQQWILEPIEPEVLSAMVSALRESFPHVRVFRSVEGWGFHCLAGRRPIPDLSAEELASRMPEAAARDLLEFGPHRTAEGQIDAVIGKEIPAEALGRGPALKDDRPVNEYYLLRTRKNPSR
jgi:spermidine synthase